MQKTSSSKLFAQGYGPLVLLPYHSKNTDCQAFELQSESGVVSCLKRCSYWSPCEGGTVNTTMQPQKLLGSRTKSPDPALVRIDHSLHSVPSTRVEGRKEWDEKHRFFSRPHNLPNRACGSFESSRMRNYFDGVFDDHLYNQTPIPECDDGSTVNSRIRSIKQRMAACESLIDLSRARAAEKGCTSGHSGYRWPKYKYFSSGLNCPSSGTIDKLLLADNRYSIVR